MEKRRNVALPAPLLLPIYADPPAVHRSPFTVHFRPMEIDLLGDHASRAYPILASLVTPRPIALVTSINEAGIVNAAPFSFFNLLGADPPILGICPGDRNDGTPKDTARNIRASHQFVVNLVDEAIAEAMNKCA